jgi:hypothetical protein
LTCDAGSIAAIVQAAGPIDITAVDNSAVDDRMAD